MCRKLCFLPDFFRYKKYNIITGTINTYPLPLGFIYQYHPNQAAGTSYIPGTFQWRRKANL